MKLKSFLLPLFLLSFAFSQNGILTFNTAFDSTGQSSFTYPVSTPNKEALFVLQKNFVKQRFDTEHFEHSPIYAFYVYLNDKKKTGYVSDNIFSDSVSVPVKGIVQYVTPDDSHMGGVHGASNSKSGFYDIATGKQIEIQNDFLQDATEALTQVMVNEFLKMKGIKSLQNYDYTQETSDFIPDRSNLRLSQKGITFIYSHNRIAPYSEGEQRIFVSWAKLKPYFVKGSFLDNIAK